jgi:hypothetical protein
MSHQISVSTKQCGTCKYWDGDRNIVLNSGKPIYVKTGSNKENCIASQSSQKMYATSTCGKYLKWEKI